MAPRAARRQERLRLRVQTAPAPGPGGDHLVLTVGCDVARTGEAFCDDPIAPDVLTATPLEDALTWLRSF